MSTTEVIRTEYALYVKKNPICKRNTKIFDTMNSPTQKWSDTKKKEKKGKHNHWFPNILSIQT